MVKVIKKFLMERYKANPQQILTMAREENTQVERFIYYLGFKTKNGKEVKKTRINKLRYNSIKENHNIEKTISF